MTLQYYDGTRLNAKITVGSQYKGCAVSALVARTSGTPYAAVRNLSCSLIGDDGVLEIVADGTGFVKGHVLQVYYTIVSP